MGVRYAALLSRRQPCRAAGDEAFQLRRAHRLAEHFVAHPDALQADIDDGGLYLGELLFVLDQLRGDLRLFLVMVFFVLPDHLHGLGGHQVERAALEPLADTEQGCAAAFGQPDGGLADLAALGDIAPPDIAELLFLRQLFEIALRQLAALHRLQDIGQQDEMAVFRHQLIEQEQIIVPVDLLPDLGEQIDRLGQLAV